jgi:hypothetical protein
VEEVGSGEGSGFMEKQILVGAKGWGYGGEDEGEGICKRGRWIYFI